jgi:YacP-like NYN domain
MLARVEEPLVVVDAWNVIRSRWPNFEPDRFLRLVLLWAERSGVEALVVFDGGPPQAPDGVTVVGTGAASADDWIARHAEQHEERPLWVVTSDRELRRRVEPYVERIIGGGSFAGELETLSD